MSILIKGVKMPRVCADCFALDEYGDYPVCRITGEQRGYNFRIYEKRMEKCPLIEVSERKVGEWVDELVYRDWEIWDGYTYCSECKQTHEYGYRPKFCPNCGAEMKGESDDTD